MKRTLALLAAAVMVAAPFGIAMAEDAAAPATDATAAPAATAAVTQDVMLKDGTKITVDADSMAWIVGADGTKTAAPDGDHVLADDTVLKVEAGKVTAGLPAAAPAMDAAPAGEAKPE